MNKVLLPYIGCDETGVGDYLAPVICCAVYFDQKTSEILNKFNVKDSKKLTDTYIYKVGKELKKLCLHCIYSLDNSMYNKLIDKGYNAHFIKSFLHNKCLTRLIDYNNISSDTYIILDKYSSEKNYRKYLKDIDVKYIPNLFVTKAETIYPGVALASIISRFTLLEYKVKFLKKYNFELPLGAGKNVDRFSEEFIRKYGIEKFKNISKWHFSNTNRICNMK